MILKKAFAGLFSPCEAFDLNGWFQACLRIPLVRKELVKIKDGQS